MGGLDPEDRRPVNVISVLIRDLSYLCLFLSCEKREVSMYEQEIRLSPDTKSANDLMLGFSTKRTMKNKLFLSYSIWYFVIAAQIDQDNEEFS